MKVFYCHLSRLGTVNMGTPQGQGGVQGIQPELSARNDSTTKSNAINQVPERQSYERPSYQRLHTETESHDQSEEILKKGLFNTIMLRTPPLTLSPLFRNQFERAITFPEGNRNW